MDSINIDSVNVDNSPEQAKVKDIIERINILIDSFMQEHGFENISDITANQFDAMCLYIRFNLFDADKTLLYKYYPNISHNNKISLMYDDYICLCICDYYIYLCGIYNKIPSIYSYSQLTGINYDSIMRWAKEESQRPDAYEIYKKLHKAYEKGLENGAQSGKNPVGFIATLNHRFGWSADNKPTLTVNITRTKQEILSGVDQALLTDNPENP